MAETLPFIVKGKAIPFEAWTDPWGSKGLRLPEILNIRHVKVLRLSAPRTSRPPPPPFPRGIPGTYFCSRKNPNDPVGNRTRAVPQQTAPRCTSWYSVLDVKFSCITRSKHFTLCLIFNQGLYERFELGRRVFCSSTCADFNYSSLRGMWLLCGLWFQNVRRDFKYFYMPFFILCSFQFHIWCAWRTEKCFCVLCQFTWKSVIYNLNYYLNCRST